MSKTQEPTHRAHSQLGRLTLKPTGQASPRRTKYEYDALGQVKSGKKYWSDGTPVAGQQFEYAFDDIGNRTQTKAGGSEFGENFRTSVYTPNLLNQYTGRTVPGAVDVMGVAMATNTVTVDGQTPYRKGEYFRKELSVNNSTSPVWKTVTVSASGETNVQRSEFVPQATESFTHDLDGNLLTDGRWSYTWNAENRLVAMAARTSVGPQVSLKFEYDSQCRRIRKQVWGNASWSGSATNDLRFVYDGWNLLATLNAQLSPLNSFMWGSDLSGTPQGAGGVGGLLAVSYHGAQTTNAFVAFDGNGNVMALVNAADGKTVARYDYGPFGEVIRSTGHMAGANPFRFSTKYQDEETDLLYYGYRYYSASMERWWSRDPLTDEAFASGLPLWVKKRVRKSASSVQERTLASAVRPLTSGPRGLSSLMGNISSTLAIARETSNPYQFVRNAATGFVDQLGLKPCSSCSAADIEREGIARGLEYIHRTIEENREYGGKICCNECLSRVYSANVVSGPVGEGTVNIANSKCRVGDKVVADWHTHPDGSTQTGTPGQYSPDRQSVMSSASPAIYDCDYVGFMTNNHLDTTRMDGQGVETTVGTSSGDIPSSSE